MICPKCRGMMETVTFGGVEVARCTECKGLWFEALEAERLKQMKGAESIDSGDTAMGRKMDTLKKIECPVCHTAMIRMVDIDHPNVHFESCKVCFGAFFDAGEFRHLKESHVAAFFRKLVGK
jgi:Zn-finger nucleic acid-binding protein